MRESRRAFALTWLLLAVMTLATACASGPATDLCATLTPIYVSRDDVLTDSTVRQILVINETWERLCKE